MRATLTLALAMLALNADAGWFSKAKTKPETPTTLSPAIGYTEKVTTETNSWAACVENWKRGARHVEPEMDTLTMNATNYIPNWCYIATNGYITLGYSEHVCPECTKPHIEDWPKTKTTVQGVQDKTTTTVYKDGKVVTIIEEYAYPHRKITVKTVTRIEYKAETETTIDEGCEP